LGKNLSRGQTRQLIVPKRK